MTGEKPRPDSRVAAARYRAERATPVEEEGREQDAPRAPTTEDRAKFVEISLQQAIRRGDFDDLPGAGRPLPNLQQAHDPDWWIRRKIEREGLTGLGPPALTLRTEDAALDARLDGAPSEAAVRELLEDFNSRVVEARRQLLGGPPVITPTQDVEAEVARWRERRAERARASEYERARGQAARARMTWWRRRLPRRGR